MANNNSFTKEELLKMLEEVDDNKQIDFDDVVKEKAEQMIVDVAPVSSRELVPTSLSQLRTYSQGEVVKLPDFGNGQEFIARLKRPSLMFLAKTGKIPNQLLSSAATLFNTGSLNSEKSLAKDKQLQAMYDILKVMAEAALVEPTFKDITDAGLELTDEQLLSIFTYTQQGAKMMEPFRNK